MTDKLPYTLTEGVVAAREGLYLHGRWDLSAVIGVPFDTPDDDTAVYAWRFIAERLRYREGEPWCIEHEYDYIACHKSDAEPLEGEEELALHRLAAILCDDAEAFRVLHWCVATYSTSKETEIL